MNFFSPLSPRSQGNYTDDRTQGREHTSCTLAQAHGAWCCRLHRGKTTQVLSPGKGNKTGNHNPARDLQSKERVFVLKRCDNRTVLSSRPSRSRIRAQSFRLERREPSRGLSGGERHRERRKGEREEALPFEQGRQRLARSEERGSEPGFSPLRRLTSGSCRAPR